MNKKKDSLNNVPIKILDRPTGVVSSLVNVKRSFSTVSEVAAFIVPKEAVYTSIPDTAKSKTLIPLDVTGIVLNIM
jgi:hypothetical protein